MEKDGHLIIRQFSGVSVSRSEEALSVLCHAREQRLNVYVGYAGWGAGQLEREIQDGSWWTVEVDADFIFETKRLEMWSEAFSALGGLILKCFF